MPSTLMLSLLPNSLWEKSQIKHCRSASHDHKTPDKLHSRQSRNIMWSAGFWDGPWGVWPISTLPLGYVPHKNPFPYVWAGLVTGIGWHYHHYGIVYGRGDFADVIKVPNPWTLISSQGGCLGWEWLNHVRRGQRDLKKYERFSH